MSQNTDSKFSSWADMVERREMLPPTEVVVANDIKIVTTYDVNSDGRIVKTTRHYKIQKVSARTKAIATRRSWKKFGAAANDPPGVNPAHTFVGEEIFMQFLDRKKEASHLPTVPLLGKAKTTDIQCRHCQGAHWSLKCPFKTDMSTLQKDAIPPPTAAASADSQEKGKAAKYVIPSLRDRRGGDSGNSRGKGDLHTVRVTNLPEETTDSDINILFRPFGPMARIFLSRNRHTGLCKGFAFISYHCHEDAENALHDMDGFGFENLILRVEWAHPTTK